MELLLLLAAVSLSRRETGPILEDAIAGWVWPMPVIPHALALAHDIYPTPTISDGFGSPRDGGKRQHAGVDVMYQRRAKLPRKPWPKDGGSPGFYVPSSTPALCASAGRIWAAGKGATGWYVIVDHGPRPYATYYTHMTHLEVPRVSRVRKNVGVIPLVAGQRLGIVGHSPLDGQRVVHLHFELRRGVTPVDPGPTMRQKWRMIK